MDYEREKLLDFKTAFNLVVNNALTKNLEIENIHLNSSLGRVIAEDIISSDNVPALDNSAMDGFCVKYDDVANASEINPIELCISDYIYAGSSKKKLKEGTCAYIATGAVIPEGADSVINIEKVEILKNPDRILIKSAPIKGLYIRKAGSDIKSGDKILAKGTKLGITEIAILCSLGIITFKVYRKPKVAIITSGNELVMPFEMPLPWQVRNSNTTLLFHSVNLAGGEPFDLGIIKDNPENAVKTLENAFAFADLVITSGGISKGIKDPFIQAFEMLNIQKIFHGLSIKPGKPLYFGVKDKTFIFGLPGNQASNFVTFNIFVKPFIQILAGMKDYNLKKIYLPLAKDILNRSGRDHFLRGRLTNENSNTLALPYDQQESHSITSIKEADILIHHPSTKEIIYKGEIVECYLLNSI